MGRTKQAPVREPDEAWAMALENKGLVYHVLLSYLRSQGAIAWYKDEALRAELESHAWEGMYQACLAWDESKGKLSTYAVPSIHNSIIKAVNKLISMGGNRRGGPGTPGEGMEFPKVFSTEAIDASMQEILEAEEINSISDTIPQPWEAENVFEDDLLDKLDMERTERKVRELAERMPEPHREVFKLMVLGPQQEPIRGQTRKSFGPSMTQRQASKELHYSLLKVRGLYLEAVEWMGYQLEAAGYGNPYKIGETDGE